LFWFSFFAGRRIRKYVDVDPSFQQLYFDRPGPFVFIAAHLGNWEIMGQIATLSGDPISSVAKPLKNRFADVVVNRLRRSTGQVIQQSSGALRELLRVLKAGGKVGLVMDQNTRVESGGLFVNFWGLPVPVSKAPAFLALRTKGNVSIGYCLPQEKGRYRIYMDALPSFEKVTVEEGTALILAEIEKVIRKYPGQWLWMYKRWKHVPEGDDGARYPFYKRMGKNG
jgi:KDO2-lipid IV(A) lauroyltransferase